MVDYKLLLVGVLMLVVGGFLLYLAIRNKLKCRMETEATIVSIERKHSNRKNHYYPVVEFSVNGKMIHETADISSLFSTKFKQGEMLKVLYNEENPKQFVIRGKSFRADFFGGLFLFVVGVGCVIMQFIG
ncbi:MAG: DUF3592 domain-containing protein [Lachnospiraceae bacterium]|nr:DUF3592 domain-containing protein [Lachnospiraceae bacterium]